MEFINDDHTTIRLNTIKNMEDQLTRTNLEENGNRIDVERIFDNGVYTYKRLAKILHSEPGLLEHIAPDRLVRHKCGKEIIIFGDDAMRWVRTDRRVVRRGSCDDKLLCQVQDELLSSPPDGGVRRLPNRRKS